MSQLQLKPMLPAGTITFIPAKTTIDLTWGNEYIEQRIIKCRTAKSSEHGSDHHPIETILNLHPCPEMAIESNRVEPNRASNSVFLFETRFNRTEPNRGPVRLGSTRFDKGSKMKFIRKTGFYLTNPFKYNIRRKVI